MHSVHQIVDTVNMPYHHGNLREALLDAAMGLARQAGPDAVVLRAVTRATGVSHNAAYRHFEDRDTLLQAVCSRCMEQLAALMEARHAELPPCGDPPAAARAELRTAGRAYVEFALAEPGWFRTAFAVPHDLSFDPVDGRGPGGRNPYEMLSDRLDRLVDVGALPPGRRPGAEYTAWSAVHGLATLLIDGPLRGMPAGERDHALAELLRVVESGL